MAGSSGSASGLGPYWLPLGSFLVLVQLAARAPVTLQPAFFFAKVALPLLLLLGYARGGGYPELRGYRPAPAQLAGDIAVGMVGALLWMAPYVLVEAWRPGPETAFDPEMLGPGLAWLAITVRGVGYAGVTPFAEELFARSWLHRYVESLAGRVDFRSLPIGTPSRAGFVAVVVYWLFSHASWEAPVAVVWAALTTLWLYHRRHLMALVVVHASSNLCILLAALIGSGRLVGGNGEPLDLWFFL